MGAVFWQQIHDHLKSLRFAFGLAALLLSFLASSLVYTWKMERLAREQAIIAADDEKHFADIETLAQAVEREYRISIRLLGTEFVCEGGSNWFMDAFKVPVATGVGAPTPTNLRTTNFWMRRFDVLDWTLVVRLMLSFLCVVLAYDAISGEMERGTLRLVLANPLSRARFLAGKFLAHLAVLMAAVLAGCVCSLLVLSLGGVLVWEGRLLGALLFFVLGTALYAALFLCLAMGASALARDSTSSLVVLLLVWAVLVVLLPQASYPLAVHLVEAPGDFRSRAAEVVEEAREALTREGVALRGREEGRVDGYAVERRYAQRLEQAGQESERIVREADAQMLRRYFAARAINLLSPGFAFQYGMEAMLGTGVARRQHFFAQAWRYRDELRHFFRARDAADTASPQVLFLPQYMSEQPLDAAQIPRFAEVRLPLERSAASGAVPLGVLALEAVGALFFALWAFARMDLTGG